MPEWIICVKMDDLYVRMDHHGIGVSRPTDLCIETGLTYHVSSVCRCSVPLVT